MKFPVRDNVVSTAGRSVAVAALAPPLRETTASASLAFILNNFEFERVTRLGGKWKGERDIALVDQGR